MIRYMIRVTIPISSLSDLTPNERKVNTTSLHARIYSNDAAMVLGKFPLKTRYLNVGLQRRCVNRDPSALYQSCVCIFGTIFLCLSIENLGYAI